MGVPAEVFEKGEKVIYPQFGLGTIAEVTKKEVGGTDHSFYRLEFPLKKIEILVPVKRATENGLRKVMTDSEVEAVLEFLKTPTKCSKPQQWHQWRKKTQELVKSGDPLEIAKIYCQLMALDSEKGLSFTEKKILAQVELLLVSEISAAKGLSEDDAASLFQIKPRKTDADTVEVPRFALSN